MELVVGAVKQRDDVGNRTASKATLLLLRFMFFEFFLLIAGLCWDELYLEYTVLVLISVLYTISRYGELHVWGIPTVSCSVFNNNKLSPFFVLYRMTYTCDEFFVTDFIRFSNAALKRRKMQMNPVRARRAVMRVV